MSDAFIRTDRESRGTVRWLIRRLQQRYLVHRHPRLKWGDRCVLYVTMLGFLASMQWTGFRLCSHVFASIYKNRTTQGLAQGVRGQFSASNYGTRPWCICSRVPPPQVIVPQGLLLVPMIQPFVIYPIPYSQHKATLVSHPFSSMYCLVYP